MNQDSPHINQLSSLLAQAEKAHAQSVGRMDESSNNQTEALLSRAQDMLHQAGIHHGRRNHRGAHAALTSAASHIGTIGRLLGYGNVRPQADAIASAYRRDNLG